MNQSSDQFKLTLPRLPQHLKPLSSENTEAGMVDYLMGLYGENYKCLDANSFYWFDKKYAVWQSCTKSHFKAMLNTIILHEYAAALMNDLKDIKYEPHRRKIDAHLSTLLTARHRREVITNLIDKIARRREHDFMFNRYTHVVHFKTKKLDMRKLASGAELKDCLVDRVQSDYCTITLNYDLDLSKVDSSHTDVYEDFFRKFIPDNTNRHAFLEIIANAFRGEVDESFLTVIGKGGNGKSVAVSILRLVGECMVYGLERKTLLSKNNDQFKRGLSRFQSHPLRLVYCEENDGQSINSELIKQLTSGNSIELLKMRQERTYNVTPQALLMMFLNVKLKLFDDYALNRRGKLLEVNSQFLKTGPYMRKVRSMCESRRLTDEEMVTAKEKLSKQHIYLAENGFVDKFRCIEMKSAFWQFITPYIVSVVRNRGVTYPPSFASEFKKSVMEYDDLADFLQTRIEVVSDDLSIADRLGKETLMDALEDYDITVKWKTIRNRIRSMGGCYVPNRKYHYRTDEGKVDKSKQGAFTNCRLISLVDDEEEAPKPRTRPAPKPRTRPRFES